MSKWDDEAIEAGSGDMWDQEGIIEGIYVAMRTDVGPNDSNVYLIKTTDEATGEIATVGVWGSTVLDGKFNDIPLNSEVQIEFTGMSEKKGKFGKYYKEYRVRYIPAKGSTGQPQLNNVPGGRAVGEGTDPQSQTANAKPSAPQGQIKIDNEIKSAPAQEDLGIDKDY